MALNELATSAVKYGALDEGDGQLSIHLTRGPDTIIVRREECGALHAPSGMTAGFGAALLDRTAGFQRTDRSIGDGRRAASTFVWSFPSGDWRTGWALIPIR